MVHVNDRYVGRSKAKLEETEKNENNKHPKKFGFLKAKFVEFCKRTDLHGFKYIVMEDLNAVERVSWACAIVISIIFAAYFVITAYRWYARNPIVTVIESTQGAIWDVPFPAVTICDLNVVSRRAARALADELMLPSNVSAEDVYQTFRWVPLLHSSNLADESQKRDLLTLQEVLDLNNISIESLFRRLSPVASCSNLVQRCMWKNTMYRCEHLFQQIFMMISLCCTFNYYAVDVLEGGNVNNELLRMQSPRRVSSCGYQSALTVMLNTDAEDYYSATVASRGSVVLIENAYNLPDLDSPVRLVNPATEVLIALSPERTYTTSGIKSFSPNDRQCYYNDEVQVGDFRQYSFHNCMAYQKVEIIRKLCDCVPFFFPMKEPSEEPLEVPFEVFKCLPECEHYDYILEVALGKLAKNVPLNGLPFFDNIDLENRSVLNVFFNDLVSTRYRRDVFLNWQNILAAFGGLLSLMLGFTLISGFDFLLFFTFRMAYDTFSRDRSLEKVAPQSYVIKVEEFHRKQNWQQSKNSMLADEMKIKGYGNYRY